MQDDGKRKREEPEPSGLRVTRLMAQDADARLVCAEAADADGRRCVVQLTKPPFTEVQVRSILEGAYAGETQHRNDRFSKHELLVPAEHNSVAAMLICPATDLDVAKYSATRKHLVRESAEAFRAATAPFVEGLPASQLTWVWNILARKKEAELILDESEHFMLVPDSKWDRHDTAVLHCLAIAKDRGLRSLRDLRGQHVPMLRHVLQRASAAILAAHGLPRSQLRVYVHYLPTFWHLHVHFAAVTCPAAGGGASVGKAVLLEDVIDNLVRDPEYYATAALTYAIGESDPLYPALRAVLPEQELPEP